MLDRSEVCGTEASLQCFLHLILLVGAGDGKEKDCCPPVLVPVRILHLLAYLLPLALRLFFLLGRVGLSMMQCVDSISSAKSRS